MILCIAGLIHGRITILTHAGLEQFIILPNFWDTTVIQHLFKEGTVSISMIDAKTDKTIWQGWTTNELNGNQFSSKEVQKNVKSIFKKFDTANK